MIPRVRSALALIGLVGAAASAVAAPVTPTFGRFGALPGATFGGSGIPNDAVAVTTVGNGSLVLGLTAHSRYDAPGLSNDGAGTFTALTGISQHLPSPADPYSLWNVGFYVGGSSAWRYTYALFFDVDPLADTDWSQHERVAVGTLSLFGTQNSLNLGMNLMQLLGGYTFDPTKAGEYSFGLVAYDWRGREVARSAIEVDVVDAVPEPATLALAGLALVGAAAARRRRRG